jgi:hypothetical protein
MELEYIETKKRKQFKRRAESGPVPNHRQTTGQGHNATVKL